MSDKKTDFYVKKMQKFFIMLISLCSGVFLLGGCTPKSDTESALYQLQNQQAVAEHKDVAEEVESVSEQENTEFLCVHICGAIKKPGVYELPKGSRVYALIELAGGLTEEADSNYVNQAQLLQDADKIVIPTLAEAEAMSNKEDGLVNINTADESELCTLPGVGEAKAKAIISYRTRMGSFNTIEDIMNISGIKEGLYEKIADYICVE